MKLTKLQQLAEAKVPSSEETRARNLFDRLEKAISAVDSTVNGKVLEKLLADQGFPATESKELIESFKKFFTAFEDLKMSVLSPFDELHEAAKNKVFDVMIKYDDPSGSGIASVTHRIKSLSDDKHARHVAELKVLPKYKGKNPKIFRVTEVKPIKEAKDKTVIFPAKFWSEVEEHYKKNGADDKGFEAAVKLAKKRIDDSPASDENKQKAHAMVKNSTNIRKLLLGMSNFTLAHGDMKVIK